MFKNVQRIFTDKVNETVNKITYFKDKFPYEKRLEEATRIIEKYPNRVPIIVERGNHNVKQIDRKKYLVPRDLSMGQFMHIIRERIKLPSHESIYLFIGGSLPPTSALIEQIYEKHKDTDNFLYVTYCAESTFG